VAVTEFGPRVVEMFGFQVSQTVVTTWFIMAVVMIGTLVLTRNLKKVPTGPQVAVESAVTAINNLVKQTMGEHNMAFAPFIGTLFLFIGLANIAGIVGLRPPTADLNVTMGLSISVFFLTQYFGLKTKRLGGYLKGFFEPMGFLLPLNIIGELANPVSLGFRLFGNVVGGLIIMSLVYGGLAGITAGLGILENFTILQVGLPVVLHVYFDLFSGLLQSFIFSMLTMVFISGAME